MRDRRNQPRTTSKNPLRPDPMHFPQPFRRVLIVVATISLASTSSGDPPGPPAWWSAGNLPAINSSAVPNNKGPANIGQAKYMAKRALDALESDFPQISADIESDLVGPGKIIPDWAAPAPGSELAHQQHAALLVGQLKAIAAPFYSHLASYSPLSNSWLASSRAVTGTQDAADSFNIYPWTSTTTDDSNKSIATIGQLKAVFALKFDHFALADTNPAGDQDGDGLSNLTEVVHGLNPQNYNPNPGIPGNLRDLDEDGMTIESEFAQRLDLKRKDNPKLKLRVTAE